MKKINIFALWTLLLIALPTQAVRHYNCDFESEAARNRWVMNPTANATIASSLKNKWYIGEPGNNDKNGHYGLYISNNDGVDAQYESTGCWNFAYDTISLEQLASGDDYTVYFDWCAMGNVASDFDGLYLLWIPMTKPNGDSIKVRSIAFSSSSIPSQYEDYVVQLQPRSNIDYLGGTATWRQCAATIPGDDCDGTPHYLAFVWTNGSLLPQQPAAMVDNINITDNKPCDAPTNLEVTPNGTTVSLTWNGTATEYEVSAYSYDADTWAGPKLVTGNATSFTGLPIGQTDFIVRAKCDMDFYSLKTIVSKLIYYPDQMCVDYLNLNNAVCYINNSSPSDASNFEDFKVVRPVDHGPSSIDSRHVVHFDRTELDPNTGNMAKTVPQGELASVRLGNWNSGNEAERIEFSFEVDTIKYPVLLLKYMPILEAPGHGVQEDPRFKLDIIVGNTAIPCGHADFTCLDVWTGSSLKPGAAAQGWHVYTPTNTSYAEPIVWKDWTTVGVNLKQYAGQGQTITARLTTHDCTRSGHFGYAYFTLGCSDGKFKDMKCGQINPTFIAPDGFNYRWIKAEDEQYRHQDGSIDEKYVKWRTQTVEAGFHDDTLYVVDCMFVQDSTCYFSLYASTLATNPISVIKQPQILRHCTEGVYKVKLDGSDSWVQEIDHVTHDTLKNKNYHIETYEWNVEGLPHGWSDEPTPTFDLPAEGGVFPYSLRTTCGTCESVVYDTLRLEPLGPTHETQTFTLCDDVRKTGFVWAERTDTLYKTYGLVDSVVLMNEITTCDSVIRLELVEPYRIYVDTMVLTDSLPFHFHGREYTKTMIDTIPFPTTCDSTWVLNFEVYEPIGITPTTFYSLCEGADSLTLEYDVYRGRSQSAWYSFIDAVKHPLSSVEEKKGHYSFNVPIDPNMEPDMYSGVLYFEDAKPEFNVTVPFSLAIHYSSALIAQRWNDVLAIRNDAAVKDTLGHRGYDYDFSAVQWYLDGQPIEGATQFNYYTGVGQHLLYGHEYTALLTRKRDGAQVFTCACLPEEVPGNMDVPQLRTLVNAAAQMPVSGRGTAYWYDTLGRLHHSDSYDNSYITAPAITGYYLVELRSGNNRSIHPVLVK